MAPAPPPRRPLSKAGLPTYLAAAKTTAYIDTTLHSTTTRSSLASAGTSSSSTSSNIRSLSWSPLGALIATGDSKILRVWNPERANVRYSTELKAPSASTNASQTSTSGSGPGNKPQSGIGQQQRITGTEKVSWNPTREAELASVGNDGIVRFWDVRNRAACVGEVKVGGDAFGLTWRPDGEELVIARKDNALIPISRRTLSQLTPETTTDPTQDGDKDKEKDHSQDKSQEKGHIYPPIFTNSGTELLLPTTQHLHILSYPSLSTIHTLTPQTASCTVVAMAPTGKHIATGGSDALLTFYSTGDLLCVGSVGYVDGPIRCAGFSWEGAYIAAGSDECAGIAIAAVDTGDVLFEVKTAGQGVGALEWCPGRYALAWGETGSGSGGLKVLGLGG